MLRRHARRGADDRHVEQAGNWALIKQKRIIDASKAFITVYDFDDTLFNAENLIVKRFDNANDEWLDFVVGNRKGNETHLYDVVIGAVANDTLYQTLSLYETGILTKSETTSRLKTHLLFDQISFHNNKVLSHLKFIESYEVFSK